MFKKGTYLFNENENFNFQLNRVVMWDGGDEKELSEVGKDIHDSSSWVETMKMLAIKAEKENRKEQAIAYWRMCEFFLYDTDQEKLKIYLKSTEMFNEYYQHYFDKEIVKKYEIPYQNGYLPVMYTKAKGETKDTILLCGGNDSYYEEFFLPMLYLSQKGFDVYIFEGPGQGGVLRIQNIKFTHEWEKPVTAILDYFDLDDVTLIGASLGGYLAPRAGAFDKRIQRIVGWSIFPDFFDVLICDHPPLFRKIMDKAFQWKITAPFNFLYKKMMEQDEVVRWNLLHGMYAYGANSPVEYVKKIRQFTLKKIADQITQDVLIIGAKEDHFIYPYLFKEEYDLLKNVRSLTFRLLTNQQDAGSHCNVGNTKLVLDCMADWIWLLKNE